MSDNPWLTRIKEPPSVEELPVEAAEQTGQAGLPVPSNNPWLDRIPKELRTAVSSTFVAPAVQYDPIKELLDQGFTFEEAVETAHADYDKQLKSTKKSIRDDINNIVEGGYYDYYYGVGTKKQKVDRKVKRGQDELTDKALDIALDEINRELFEEVGDNRLGIELSKIAGIDIGEITDPVVFGKALDQLDRQVALDVNKILPDEALKRVDIQNQIDAELARKPTEEVPTDWPKIRSLQTQLSSTGIVFYDPITGERVMEGEEMSEESQEVLNLIKQFEQEYGERLTTKKMLADEFMLTYGAWLDAKDRFEEHVLPYREETIRRGETMVGDRGISSTHYLFRQMGAPLNVKAYQAKKTELDAQMYALSMLYWANYSPENIKKDLGYHLQTSAKAFTTGALIPMMLRSSEYNELFGTPDREVLDIMKRAMLELNIPMTEGEKKKFDVTLGEKVNQLGSGLFGFMIPLGALGKVEKAAWTLTKLDDAVRLLSQGSKLKKILAGSIKVASEEGKFLLAGAPGGAGGGFSTGTQIANAAWGRVVKSGANISPWTRFVMGMVTGGTGMTAGMYGAQTMEAGVEALLSDSKLSHELKTMFGDLSIPEERKEFYEELLARVMVNMAFAGAHSRFSDPKYDGLKQMEKDFRKAGREEDANEVKTVIDGSKQADKILLELGSQGRIGKELTLGEEGMRMRESNKEAARRAKAEKLATTYQERLTKLKSEQPELFWSVDVPDPEVLATAAETGRLVDVGGGMGLVTPEGRMIGLFRYKPGAKGVAKAVQEKRIEEGGDHLDVYDITPEGKKTSLVDNYKKQGLVVVGRLKWNEKLAPKDTPQKVKDQKPDVVFMVLDKNNVLKPEDLNKRFNSYNKVVEYQQEMVAEMRRKQKTGEATDAFFGDVSAGRKGMSDVEYEPTLEITPEKHGEFIKHYNPHRGNFDDHISKSIPGHKEIQVATGDAIIKTISSGKVADIGGSENSWAKAITEMSKGKIETVTVDPQEDMHRHSDKTPVKGNTFVEKPIMHEWEGKTPWKPKREYDVVHESMVFQFVSNERKAQLDYIRDNVLKKDGLLLLEEKFIPKGSKESETKTDEFGRKIVTDSEMEVAEGLDMIHGALQESKGKFTLTDKIKQAEIVGKNLVIRDADHINELKKDASDAIKKIDKAKKDGGVFKIGEMEVEGVELNMWRDNYERRIYRLDKLQEFKEDKNVVSQLEWSKNEAKKDEYKAKYFKPEELTKKKEEVILGMHENMVSNEALEQLLVESFDHVFRYWDSGNFKGYAATNSLTKAQAFAQNIGNTGQSEFSSSPIEFIKGGSGKPPKTPIQRRIDRALGIPREKKKIVVEEYAALKDQLRLEAKVGKEIVSNAAEVREIFADFIRSKKGIAGLDAKLSTAMMNKINRIDFTKPKTIQEAMDYIDRVLEDARFRQELIEFESTYENIEKIVDPTTYEKKEGGILKGKDKFFIETKDQLVELGKEAREGNWEEAQQKLLDKIKNLEGEYPTAEEYLEIERLGFQGILNETFKGNLAELKGRFQDLKEIRKDGRTKAAAARIAYRDAMDTVRGSIFNILTGQGEKMPGLTPSEKANFRMSSAKKYLSRLDWVATDSWPTYLDKLSKNDKTSKPYRSYLSTFLLDMKTASEQGEYKGLETHINTISDKYKEINGLKSSRDVVKLSIERTKMIEEVSWIDDISGERKVEQMTQNQMYDRWMKLQDPTLVRSMETMGLLREGELTNKAKALEEALLPETREWADWQLYEFYPEYYKGINEVYRKIFGTDMSYNPFYSPLFPEVEGKKAPREDQLLADVTIRNTANNSSLKARTKHGLTLRTMDGDRVLINHVQKMEFFKNWAETIRTYEEIFSNGDIRETIRQNFGDKYVEYGDWWIDQFARRPKQITELDRVTTKIRTTFTLGSLGLKAVPLVKQLTSIPAFMDNIPIKEFVNPVTAVDNATDFFSKKKRSQLEDTEGYGWDVLMTSVYMQERVRKGWERDVMLVMQKDYQNVLNSGLDWKSNMMFLTKWGDRAAIFVGGWPVYKYHYKQAINDNLSPKEAHTIAIKEFETAARSSQQSGMVADLSFVQQANPYLKMLTMYKTAPFQYHRKAVGAVRNLIAGRETWDKALKTVAIYHVIIPAMFQLTANGFNWDGEEMLRSALIGNFNNMFAVGDAVQGIMDILGKEPWSYQASPIESVPVDVAKVIGDLGALDYDDITFYDVWEALDNLARLTGNVTGYPTDASYNTLDGLLDIISDDTNYPVRRILGWSEYRLDRGYDLPNALQNWLLNNPDASLEEIKTKELEIKNIEGRELKPRIIGE